MFTGIIEALGTVTDIRPEGSNLTLGIRSALSPQLHIDQSVSHNGVCLTVVAIEDGVHFVTAIDETLQKTNVGRLQVGEKLNLERCMAANGRFDGHVVQGHVDQTGHCTALHDRDGSWVYDFAYDPAAGNVTVEKGSICLNGVSLTVFGSRPGGFSVAIIPYTYAHTTFHQLRPGDVVNLEFDVIGKYVRRLVQGYV